MAKVPHETYIIIDKKNQEGEFLCEKIIKLSEFKEGKDWKYMLGINEYEIISEELKKRILNRKDLANDKVYIKLSDLDMRVWVDREDKVNNRFLKELFIENPVFKDSQFADREVEAKIKQENFFKQNKSSKNREISLQKNTSGWIFLVTSIFALFTLLFVFWLRKKRKRK